MSRPRVPISLEPVRIAPGTKQDALGVYRLGAFFLAGSGLFAVAMSAGNETLSRRQRAFGLASSLATVAMGARGARDPTWFARYTHERRRASVLPWAAAASTWFSKPDVSPMMFPACLLTAVGTARVGRRAGTSIGAGAAALYAGGVIVQRRDSFGRDMTWNAGVACGFVAAGHLAPQLMRLAFATRALDHARERDKAITDASVPEFRTLRDRTDLIAAKAREIDQALTRLQNAHGLSGEGRRDLIDATEQMRAAAIACTVAPILTRSAGGQQLDLASLLRDVVAAHQRTRPKIAVTWSSEARAGLALDGRSTAALVRTLQNALANAAAYGSARVDVRLHVADGTAHLEVSDDGGGSAPRTLGNGLATSWAACRRVGGNLHLGDNDRGVVVTARVPVHETVAPGDRIAISDRIDDTLRSFARVQWCSCLAQGFGALATADSAVSAFAASAAFTAISARMLVRQERRDTPTAELAYELAALGLLWPRGGRPPAGMSGNALVVFGVANPRSVAGPTLVNVAAHLVSIARGRDGIPRNQIVEHVLFPTVCGLMGGLGGHFGRDRLRALELQAGSLRDRADMVEEATDAGGAVHDIVKPLVEGLPNWWSEVRHFDEAREVIDLAGEVQALMRDISARVSAVDPLHEFQRYLATVLGPVEVAVDGALPGDRDATGTAAAVDPLGEAEPFQADLAARRARASLDLIAVADELASIFLDRYPIGRDGQWTLKKIQVDVQPVDDERVEISVQPLPPRPTSVAPDARLQSAVGRLYRGELVEGFSDARRTFTLSATDLRVRRPA